MKVEKSNKTVDHEITRRFVDLVLDGEPRDSAAKKVGRSLSWLLKRKDVQQRLTELINSADLDEELRRKAAYARLTLMVLEEDPKIALKAAQVIVGQPKVSVQVGINAAPAEALEAFKTLDIEEEKND
jgi:hypothetical protein